MEERIQSLLSTVNEVSNQLCVDEELYQIATTQFESPLECIEALNDYKTFQEYENTYPEIDVIKFYVQNDTLLNSGHFINPGARISTLFGILRRKGTTEKCSGGI